MEGGVMAIIEVTMYRLVCDRCGKSAQDASDYYAWADKDSAVNDAECDDWLLRDDGDWCQDCTVDDEERDERVPVASAAALTPETLLGGAVAHFNAQMARISGDK
jgi:hypothetical protein